MATLDREFNDDLLRVLALANRIALSMRCDEIGDEHLLLALLRIDPYSGAAVFARIGVDMEPLLSSVVAALPAERPVGTRRQLPASAAARRVFECARQEAARLGHVEVSKGHLLLALIKANEGPAWQLLADAGAVYARARTVMVECALKNVKFPPLLPLDPQAAKEASDEQALVKQTKRQIRAMVAEIRHRVQADVNPADFFGAFLTRVVASLAAFGGAIWMLDEAGDLELSYHHKLPRDGLAESRDALRRHCRFVRQTLSAGAGVVVEPHSGDGDDGLPANHTDCLLILGVLHFDGRPTGMVEIFQRPNSTPATQRGYLKFVEQMCELADEYLRRRG